MLLMTFELRYGLQKHKPLNNELDKLKLQNGRVLGWCPARDSLISWGEGSSLALAGNPSRDGVSIKILVWRHLKPNPQLLWVNYMNDVNGFWLAEQRSSSGKCSRQRNIGHHHANPVSSKRRKWTSQENKIVMECYLLSEPKIRGYRKRMLNLWLQKGYVLGIRRKINWWGEYCS